jgi:hypothetical protein
MKNKIPEIPILTDLYLDSEIKRLQIKLANSKPAVSRYAREQHLKIIRSTFKNVLQISKHLKGYKVHLKSGKKVIVTFEDLSIFAEQ